MPNAAGQPAQAQAGRQHGGDLDAPLRLEPAAVRITESQYQARLLEKESRQVGGRDEGGRANGARATSRTLNQLVADSGAQRRYSGGKRRRAPL